jgi:hypothetical protein
MSLLIETYDDLSPFLPSKDEPRWTPLPNGYRAEELRDGTVFLWRGNRLIDKCGSVEEARERAGW